MNRFLMLTLLAAALPLHARTEESPEKPAPYHQLLVGYGSSHPGWGDTTERIQTTDLILRHCRHFFKKEEGWIRGTHEFWIEVPFSFIVADSGDENANDIGFFGLNFLFAWVFPECAIGAPYLMAGGGPVYVAADIQGVGSDLCGNYQVGGGLRINATENQTILLELRYHHISNLNLASPNVALNSSKLYLGFALPF
jgi:lipid A 3-O-deacylase